MLQGRVAYTDFEPVRKEYLEKMSERELSDPKFRCEVRADLDNFASRMPLIRYLDQNFP